LQPGQDRHVVGFKLPEPRPEHIRQLAFMDENRCLTFAHGQLGAVFYGIAAGLEPPDHGVMAVACPGDDINEFAREKVEQSHLWPPYLLAGHGLARIWLPLSLSTRHGAIKLPIARLHHDSGGGISSAAMRRMTGRASSSVMPGRRRGS